MPKMSRAVPNLLSILRALLALPIILALPQHPTLALLIFIGAALLDWVDGFCARALGAESALGATLDPIADKILYLSTLVALCIAMNSAPLVSAIVFTVPAEAALVAIRVIPSLKKRLGNNTAATWVGKMKMGIQCAAVILLFCSFILSSSFWGMTGTILAFIGTACSWWSFMSHIVRSKKTTALN